MVQWILFAVCAGVGSLAAGAVVFQRRPFFSALALGVALLATAGVYYLLAAPFLAVLQVLIYAGGILALFLFVVWLAGVYGEGEPRFRVRNAVIGGATTLALLGLLGVPLWKTVRGLSGASVDAAALGSVKTFAWRLLDRFIYPLELTSFLFLAAVLAVIHLTRGRSEP